jgi:putative membrane protein
MISSAVASVVSFLPYLAPWEFSPTVVLVCVVTVVLYIRGLRAPGAPPSGFWRPFSFLLGLALTYGVLQTYFDFLSQHMFWVHRLQHLVLHHVGPFLMIVAFPGPVLRRGLPAASRGMLDELWRRSGLRTLLAWLQNPYIAGFLFVGLVYFWLTPSIHFTAMLDANRYRLMNWGMAVDGVLFWWLMLTPRAAQGSAAVNYAPRIVVLVITGFLQLVLGAFIVMDHRVLFTVYGICGRAWAISPLTDQQIGGCLTWIPPAMMSLLGALVVIHHALHDSERAVSAVPLAPAPAAPAMQAVR